MKPDISISPERKPVAKTRRKSLKPAEKVAILMKQAICPMCGQKMIDRGGAEYDHTKPLALGGLDDIANMTALCKPCHRRKTDSDMGMIAKSKRQARETGQQARRERNGPQIQSRGFDKSMRRKMNGTVEKAGINDK